MCFFYQIFFSRCAWFYLKLFAFTGLKDKLLAAQVEARNAKAQLEGEVVLNRRLRKAISDLSTSWEVEPMDESREEGRGDALVD